MRTRVLTILLMLCLLSGGVIAQSDHPAVPPLNEIFAPNVIIEYREATNSHATAYPIDSDRRVFFDGEKEVAFPPDFDIFDVFKIDDTHLGVQRRNNQVWSDTYVYDKLTGELSLFVSPCEPDSTAIYYGYGESDFSTQPWSLTIPDGSPAYLCNRVTGEKSAPLPSNYIYLIPNIGRPSPAISVSPDGRFIVFVRIPADDSYLNYSQEQQLLSYHITTKTFTILGDMKLYGSSQSFPHWVDTLVFFAGRDESASIYATDYFMADVTQADSLIQLPFSDGYDNNIGFEDNPPRIISYMLCTPPEVVFDINTRSRPIVTPMPPAPHPYNTCDPEYISPSGTRYLRGVRLAPMDECCGTPYITETVSHLIRGDKVLYSGEIEQIWWVSNDQRLAIVTIDDNDNIDFNPFALSPFAPSQYSAAIQDMGNPQIVLLDLVRGTHWAVDPYIEMPNLAELNSSRPIWKPTSLIYPVGENTVLIHVPDGQNVRNTLITSYNPEIFDPELPTYCPIAMTGSLNYLMVNPALTHQTPCLVNQFDLIEVESNDSTAFIRPPTDNTFSYQLVPLDVYRFWNPHPFSTEQWRLDIHSASTTGELTLLTSYQFNLNVNSNGTPVVTLDRP